mmetsp:Transcript_111799/g.193823  ORF Transcript_111799/g.193823 Transcript_111799/m.193823 type:complete len:249 (+) Transcript_111799:362-1108(+)
MLLLRKREPHPVVEQNPVPNMYTKTQGAVSAEGDLLALPWPRSAAHALLLESPHELPTSGNARILSITERNEEIRSLWTGLARSGALQPAMPSYEVLSLWQRHSAKDLFVEALKNFEAEEVCSVVMRLHQHHPWLCQHRVCTPDVFVAHQLRALASFEDLQHHILVHGACVMHFAIGLECDQRRPSSASVTPHCLQLQALAAQSDNWLDPSAHGSLLARRALQADLHNLPSRADGTRRLRLQQFLMPD